MNTVALFRIAASLVLISTSVGLNGLRAADRPNILWIIAEDISPFFGCYGDPDATTPNIDAFAKRSHLFTNAFSTAPICAPSRSCLGTGLYATSLGTQHLRSEVAIPKTIEPLASIFRKNGYWTALRGKTDYNFDVEGLFDYWKDDTAPWKQRPAGKPFFAFLNLGATHEGSGNMASRAAPALARLPKERIHDPETITMPPYYPKTQEMRRIWARYYDLISVWDIDVQAVLDTLEADGEAENTIVFLMADHGLGLPRYKRWLYQTGLHVPLIVHIPERFRAFSPGREKASIEERLVSYVDLPASALKLAGIEIPKRFHGQPLFAERGKEVKEREFVFGARDRADDMYDLSRSVFDGRYLYIRHYNPHLPPIQEGIIFSPSRKESLIELHRVHDQGGDNPVSQRLWEPRPFEELYDLKKDPHELNNLANERSLRKQKQALASELTKWILRTRDSGFLLEPEMHRRATEAGMTPYEMLQDPSLYPLQRILAVADAATESGVYDASLMSSLDPAMRYWNLMGAILSRDDNEEAITVFKKGLEDRNAIIRTTAAEGMARIEKTEIAISAFRDLLKETEPRLALYVARSLAISLEDASPLEKEIRMARARYLAPAGSERPWKDFTYSAFTCWALEWALIKSGLNNYSDFNN